MASPPSTQLLLHLVDALSSSETISLVDVPFTRTRKASLQHLHLFQPLQDLRYNFMDAEIGTKEAKSRRGRLGNTGVFFFRGQYKEGETCERNVHIKKKPSFF
ncbi:uncharacterized protein BDW43DRAFT_268050 [Aspergillus alliaceus]|uniref:uncharacterized protein n=1 Tax=Petromyces alliaceus TaxID=209559 RepID=UPI0012A59F7B|nr:uncharacterized protein BDW43DRAFT_268050 [Aspergillus alliaceus]KAB8236288.1 hypothetical protein BDW43DRAFT_268050 [Aspergillus alliaceus]